MRRRKQQEANKPPTTNDGLGVELMTIEQFCQMVPISRGTYERLKKQGKGPKVVRLGPRWLRISMETARAWIKAREER